MRWVRNGGWQRVFVRWWSILDQREWIETLPVTKTKFRQRMAGEAYTLVVFVWFDCFMESICDGLACEW